MQTSPDVGSHSNKLRAAALGLTVLLVAGCITSGITNLTPTQVPRNTTGIYRIEMIWESNQQALRPETIQPEVQVTGHNATYPMTRTQLLTNRWETLVGPLRPEETNLFYRIKVNWKYNAIPVPRSDSQIDGPFRLRIVD